MDLHLHPSKCISLCPNSVLVWDFDNEAMHETQHLQIIKSKKKLLKIPCVLPPVFERDLLINTSEKKNIQLMTVNGLGQFGFFCNDDCFYIELLLLANTTVHCTST